MHSMLPNAHNSAVSSEDLISTGTDRRDSYISNKRLLIEISGIKRGDMSGRFTIVDQLIS